MASPTPLRDPIGWTSAYFGDIEIPPRGFGCVTVETSSAIKTDSKKKKGKKSATVTRNEKEQNKLKLTVHFLAQQWEQQPYIEENLDLIDPNGPNEGGPFQFTFPGLGPGAPQFVQVTSVSRPVKWSGTLGEVTIECEETDLAVGTGTGGTGGGTASSTSTLTQEQILALEAEKAVLNFENINDLVPLATSDETIKAAARERIQKRNARILVIQNQLDAAQKTPADTGSTTPTSADAKNASPASNAGAAWTSGKNPPNAKP